MIAHDSPLRRLPAPIDRKQALFLDGVRHAAEIASFAYSRLARSLAEIAVIDSAQAPPQAFVEPFVDAWAIVDSIDRLRELLRLMPGLTFRPSPDNRPRFLSATDTIRSLRNVSDHLAARADYVVARKGTALGVLTWVTPIDDLRAHSCILRPGILKEGKSELNNPLGRTVRTPSDMICLEAGEYRASLTDAMDALAVTISYLEDAMRTAFQAQNLEHLRAGSDVLLVAQMDMIEPPAS